MNFSGLETFLVVAETGSFSKAANSLHLTQPAITKRIKSLEKILNTRLFDRVGKRVHLSAGGQLLLPRARALILAMTDTQRLMQNLSERITGLLHLATSHHVGLHRLAPVLKDFSNSFDDVQLDIRFEDSEAAHELVRRGDSELAVVTLNPQGDRSLDYQTLWDDPLCFIVAGDHPLAAAGSVALGELARYTAVLPGLATYTGRIVAELFADRQIELSSHLSTNYLETISMLAGIGLGWSVLPASMVTGNLVQLSTDAPPLRRTLGCVTNPNRTQSNAAQAFIEVLGRFADPA
jgi:DNA-binding transcriptional LysR family regulator